MSNGGTKWKNRRVGNNRANMYTHGRKLIDYSDSDDNAELEARRGGPSVMRDSDISEDKSTCTNRSRITERTGLTRNTGDHDSSSDRRGSSNTGKGGGMPYCDARDDSDDSDKGKAPAPQFSSDEEDSQHAGGEASLSSDSENSEWYMSDSYSSDYSDDDEDKQHARTAFEKFRMPEDRARMVMRRLGGRRPQYAMEKAKMPRWLQRDFKDMERFFTQKLNLVRGAWGAVRQETYEKTEERVRGLLGYLVQVTNGQCLRGLSPSLENLLYNERDKFLGYIRYLRDERGLTTSTLSNHASMIIVLLRYLFNITKVDERKKVYQGLFQQWRDFRNSLTRAAQAASSRKDLDTERALGKLTPTYQELVAVVAHLLRKAKKAEGGRKHVAVQEACIMSLFVLLPAMRSGIWRTMQLHQEAFDDHAHQKYLDEHMVNYMFYNKNETTFTVVSHKNNKRNHPVTMHIRHSDVPKVHAILLLYIANHREALLTTARDRRAGQDYLFFNSDTGHPLDTSNKMTRWISNLVTRSALEMGLHPDRIHQFKCTPHHCRHAMWEYVHRYVVCAGVI